MTFPVKGLIAVTALGAVALWDVVPYRVNANLHDGDMTYMMNKSKSDAMTEAEQTAVMEAAHETDDWLKARHEDWVDQRIGTAVMKGGAAAVSMSRNTRAGPIESVQASWNATVDEACGPELAGQIRDLFAQHAP
ncbi:MAG: hypothetical protein R6V26_14400 [Roseovarius sp.]